jgi:hypothetical protein
VSGERALDVFLHVVCARLRLQLDLVEDVVRADDVRRHVLSLVPLVLPVCGTGQCDEAVVDLASTVLGTRLSSMSA